MKFISVFLVVALAYTITDTTATAGITTAPPVVTSGTASEAAHNNNKNNQKELLKVYENFFTQDDFDSIEQHKVGRAKTYHYKWTDTIDIGASILTTSQTQRLFDLIGVDTTTNNKPK